MNSLKIVIAGANPTNCSEIESSILLSMPEASVTHVLSSGETLLNTVLSFNPDVVICDANLPGISCFEVIQRVSSVGVSNAQFIVYGNRDFDAVYKSLKYGAIDYLLLPISPDSLKTTIDRAASLRSYTSSNSASRILYVDDKGADALKNKVIPVSEVNKMFGTNFSEGLFRMIFVKYDSLNAFNRLSRDMNDVKARTEEQIRRSFECMCDDIVCNQKKDGVMAVLNYDKSKDSLFDVNLQELYKRICRMAYDSNDVTATVCVSDVVADPCEVGSIKEQVRDVEWSRMVYGTNKILYWKNTSVKSDKNAMYILDTIFRKIRTSIESLNSVAFKNAIDEYYKLPKPILLSREARQIFKQIIYIAIEMYWDAISVFSDPTERYEEIAYCSHLCTSFDRHRDIITSKYIQLITDISGHVDTLYALPINEAIIYIKSNLGQPLSLNTVAAAVDLSPGYFSHLFRKETGITFTKYVTLEKNKYATHLLSRTMFTISEIADKVGFPDVRAFSKQFKTINNMTPSRYRQLHSSVGLNND